MISDKAKIPLYGILSNEQLALMAQKIHQKQKYKQFGDVFISAVQKFCRTGLFL